MPKQIALGLSVQQVGGYLYFGGLVLEELHGELFQEVGAVAEAIGLGLETGQGTFGPIPFNVPQADGVYVTDAGLALGVIFQSPGLQAASIILVELGVGVTSGVGSVGPIRIGNEGLTLNIANNQLTGTLGPWQG
jgi:hypothetical protein